MKFIVLSLVFSLSTIATAGPATDIARSRIPDTSVQAELTRLHSVHALEVEELHKTLLAAYETAEANYRKAMSRIGHPPTQLAEELNRRVQVALDARRTRYEQAYTDYHAAYETSVLSYVSAANAACLRHTRLTCLWSRQ